MIIMNCDSHDELRKVCAIIVELCPVVGNLTNAEYLRNLKLLNYARVLSLTKFKQLLNE